MTYTLTTVLYNYTIDASDWQYMDIIEKLNFIKQDSFIGVNLQLPDVLEGFQNEKLITLFMM